MIDIEYIYRQMAFSQKTFGPGTRTKGIIAHIRKELDELEENPTDVYEWADVIILALDGAWRTGHRPNAILNALIHKQEINETRTWPDWKTVGEDEAIEHVR